MVAMVQKRSSPGLAVGCFVGKGRSEDRKIGRSRGVLRGIVLFILRESQADLVTKVDVTDER
jgi:hypothetical protein